MSNIKFSVSMQAFYDSKSKNIPSDVVDVSDELHITLVDGMNLAGCKVMLVNGVPTLSEARPSLFHEWDGERWIINQVAKQAADKVEATRNRDLLRSKADAEISWLSDAVDEGMATGTEAELLLKWKKFRIELMRVDLLKPVWPELPSS